MKWRLVYDPRVSEDLRLLGRAEAARIMKAIDTRIARGEPDKIGRPLRGELAGCRRLRAGPVRIVYRVETRGHEVLILAVGPRRQDEVYKSAERRYGRT